MSFLLDLQEMGHMVTVPFPLREPVTTNGYYEDTEGWNWYVYWERGHTVMAPFGYSDAYLLVERAYLSQYGAALEPEEMAHREAWILANLTPRKERI